MARPAMRDITGRWSLVQVAAEAGVTHRTARTLATAGYLDANNLRYRDIVMLRVAAAALDAPRPAGQTRTETHDTALARNFEALRLTRTVLDNPTPSREATLVLSPTKAALFEDPFKLMGHLRDLNTPTLLLPVGI